MNTDMLRKADGIEGVAERSNGFVDCYVSTESDEMGWILGQQGYLEVKCSDGRPSIAEPMENRSYLKHSKTGLEIECADISVAMALEMQRAIGFPAMSRFRIYTRGSPNTTRILLSIMQGLDEHLQNMAFVNDAGSLVYTRLSSSY